MAGAVVVLAIATFLVGVAVGTLAAVFAMRRDDRYHRLTDRASDWLARGARRGPQGSGR